MEKSQIYIIMISLAGLRAFRTLNVHHNPYQQWRSWGPCGRRGCICV